MAPAERDPRGAHRPRQLRACMVCASCRDLCIWVLCSRQGFGHVGPLRGWQARPVGAPSACCCSASTQRPTTQVLDHPYKPPVSPTPLDLPSLLPAPQKWDTTYFSDVMTMMPFKYWEGTQYAVQYHAITCCTLKPGHRRPVPAADCLRHNVMRLNHTDTYLSGCAGGGAKIFTLQRYC